MLHSCHVQHSPVPGSRKARAAAVLGLHRITSALWSFHRGQGPLGAVLHWLHFPHPWLNESMSQPLKKPSLCSSV